ncbi:MAG: DUF6164 family protein [Candidatus Polarisedimenticolaceae bacterium]|nr:DUF6164 family protein [Candidatus Polarisedimenticolaceae bacterium]
MSALLFRLRNVPDDEAEEIRQLLTDHAIGFYETSAGNWGISFAGIWVKDEAQLAVAKAVIETYQKERQIRVRAEYRQQLSEGRQRRMLDVIKESPVRFLIYVAIIALVLTLSIKPFLDLAGS